MSLRATVVPVTPFQQNCSVIWSTVTHEGAVIDPGGDLDQILAAAADEGPHRDDQSWIDMLPEQARVFGMPQVATFTPTRWLVQGDKVQVGRKRSMCITVPGTHPVT